MKKRYALLLLLAFGFTANAQQLANTPTTTVNPCGTTDLMEDYFQKHPEQRQKLQEFQQRLTREIQAREQVQSKGMATPDTITYVVPVVVHVFHTGQIEGNSYSGQVPNPSFSQVKNSVLQVNKDYNAIGNNPAGVPRNSRAAVVKVRMCLATKDPDGNVLSGGAITRWDGSLAATWTGAVTAGTETVTASNYATNGIKRQTVGIEESLLSQVVQWDPSRYYNIYLVTEIDNNNGGSGTQGFAYFPGGSSDYAVMIPNSFDGTKTSITTFDHEMGHALSLYHTFTGNNGDEQGTNNAYCPAAETDCANDGDYCCDIPLHKSMYGIACKADNTPNDCAGSYGVYGDFQDNYMNYTNCSETFFSADQAKRIRATIVVDPTRKSQTSQRNLLDCGCEEYMVTKADFYAKNSGDSSIVGFVNKPIQFLDYSSHATNHQWNFGDSGTSTTKNPLHAYSSPGTYAVTLSINNGAYSSAKTQFVTIMPEYAPAYTTVQGGDMESHPADFAAMKVKGSKWSRGSSSFNGKNGTSSGANAWVLEKDSMTYSAFTESYLYTSAFNFSDSGVYEMGFKTKFLIDPDLWDGVMLEASTDSGATWQKLGNTTSTDWYNETVAAGSSVYPAGEAFFSDYESLGSFKAKKYNLSTFSGKRFVAIRFVFKSGTGASYYPGYGSGMTIDDFYINFKPKLKAVINPNKTSACINEDIIFTSNSKGNPISYSWDFGANATPATAASVGSHTVKYSTAGTKTVKLKVTDVDGLKDSITTTITIKPFPAEKTTIASPDSICPGSSTSIVLQSSESGVSYQLYRDVDNTAEGTAKTGSGSDLNFSSPTLTQTTTYKIKSTKDGCSIDNADKAIVTIRTLPANKTVAMKDVQLCQGNSGTEVQIKSSESSVQYQVKRISDNANIGSLTDGTGSDLNIPTGAVATSSAYKVIATKAGCTQQMNDTAKVKVKALPADKNLTAKSVKVCPGGATEILLTASESNTAYQLRNNADNTTIGSAVSGNGQDLSFPTGALNAATVFKVTAYNDCDAEMSQHPQVNLSEPPQQRTITQYDSVLCEGKSTKLIIKNAEKDVLYKVTNDLGASIGNFMGADEDIPVETGFLFRSYTYTIVGSLGNCETVLNNQPNVEVLTIDGTKKIVASNTFICDSGSAFIIAKETENNLLYTLKDGANSVGASQTGNGLDIQFPTGLIYKTKVYEMLVQNGKCQEKLYDTALLQVGKKPVVEIVRSGYDLRASAGGSSYQWYKEGLAIPGANKSSYRPDTTGSYSVQMVKSGCQNMSEPFYYDLTIGIYATGIFTGVQVYPNPAKDQVIIRLEHASHAGMLVLVYDQLGRKVSEQNLKAGSQQQELLIDLAGLLPGTYVLELRNARDSYRQLLSIE